MNILFDHQIFTSQKVGGISRYFYNLTHGLEHVLGCKIDKSYILNKNLFFKDSCRSFPDFSNRPYQRILHSKTFSRGLSQLSAVNTLAKIKAGNFDILHLTNHDTAYLKNTIIHKPIVLTIHDLIPELFPTLFPDIKSRLLMRLNSIQQANYFICISESTKRDFMAYYGISADRIKVIYHGYTQIDADKNFKANVCKNYLGAYFLYVGDRKSAHKNFIPMVKNLANEIKKDGIKLICVGESFSASEVSTFQSLEIDSLILAIPANDLELLQLYRNAKCFIYPSLYEGFGMPLLEAMSMGCPIISSNTSSMPEIAQEGALYFDPISFSDFDVQIKQISQNDSRNSLLEKQQKVLAQYSWEIMCQSTFDFYQAKCLSHIVL